MWKWVKTEKERKIISIIYILLKSFYFLKSWNHLLFLGSIWAARKWDEGLQLKLWSITEKSFGITWVATHLTKDSVILWGGNVVIYFRLFHLFFAFCFYCSALLSVSTNDIYRELLNKKKLFITLNEIVLVGSVCKKNEMAPALNIMYMRCSIGKLNLGKHGLLMKKT